MYTYRTIPVNLQPEPPGSKLSSTQQTWRWTVTPWICISDGGHMTCPLRFAERYATFGQKMMTETSLNRLQLDGCHRQANTELPANLTWALEM